MFTDVFTLHEETKARQAIYALQDQEDAELVFYLFTLDDDVWLTGVISLRDLVTTPSETMLKDVMSKNIQAVRADTDQEEVSRIVTFLSSEEAGFITGSTISANGGQYFA